MMGAVGLWRGLLREAVWGLWGLWGCGGAGGPFVFFEIHKRFVMNNHF